MISSKTSHGLREQEALDQPFEIRFFERPGCRANLGSVDFDQSQVVAPPKALLEDFAFKYGRSYESYLVTEPDRECFWMPQGRGVLAYLRRDRYLHVGGGLLAAEQDRFLLLTSFVDWARARGLRTLFYNIGPDDAPVFRRAGFQVTKWGEEPIIDLAGQTWSGKKFEWVRRQTNYALRQGLEFEECQPDLLPDDERNALATELNVIAEGTLSERPQVGDIGFLNGRFDLPTLGRRRLFLARNSREGRIDGFLVCNPCCGGTEWALELYRDRIDAVRGTIPFLMHQAMRQFQREGVAHASLCLVPAMRCDQPLPGDSALIRRALTLSRYFGFIFDVAGLYHFKSRFRPRFEDRYLCACPPVTFGAACSFVRVCGALRLDPVKLGRRLWRQLSHSGARATLASPDPELSSIARGC